MRNTLVILLGALLIAAAQQTTTTPPPAAQKKGSPARQEAAKGAAKKTYSFSDTVQLVVVDVFAKDKNGNPIENLKASDFTITEDGKPQTIKFCEYQELKSDPITEPPAAAALTPRPERRPDKHERARLRRLRGRI